MTNTAKRRREKRANNSSKEGKKGEKGNRIGTQNKEQKANGKTTDLILSISISIFSSS